MKHKFTLVELMVVIGIIAILGAILLPVLSKARDKAIQNECANNMRQLAMAEIAYAADNEQSFLDGKDQPSSDSQSEYKKTWVSVLYDYTKEPKIFACDADVLGDGDEYDYFDLGEKYVVSYLRNTGLPSGQKRYTCERPGNTIILGPRLHKESKSFSGKPLGYHPKKNATGDYEVKYTYFDDPLNSTECQHHRHGQVSNFAFLDGHTESKTSDAFKSGNEDPPPERRLWLNLRPKLSPPNELGDDTKP